MEPSNTETCDGSSSSSLNDTHSAGIVTTTVSYSSSLQVEFVTKLFGTVVEHQLANNINALALTVISPNFKTYENDFKRQERSDPAFQDEICSLVADRAVIKSVEDDVIIQELATKMKEKMKENAEKVKEKMKEKMKEKAEKVKEKMKEKMKEKAEKVKEKIKEKMKEKAEKVKEKMKEKIKEKMKSHPKSDAPPESTFDVIWELLMDIVVMILDHLKEDKQLKWKIMAFLSRNIKVILVRFKRLITLSLPGSIFGLLHNPTFIVYLAIMILVVILAIIIYRRVYPLGNAA